ncbi:MAG: excinuclease ABC subunit C [Desulfovibrionaceae bacterium]|nr:excinuclease ABC subunit C [Desulfovibrionaceae bacterium]
MERPIPSTIPTTPGVYLYKDAGGRIIYVGKARNLRRRILSYFRPPAQLTPKTAAMMGHAVSLETLNTTTEKEALLLEASLIKKHRPHYNIVLRDDKQYVLFRLSEKDEFPRLEITRKVRRRDGARYFGPFTSGMAARETWKAIHRIFPLRRCTDRALRNRVKPCLYHHIHMCPAPCSGAVSPDAYADITRKVVLLLEGKSRELLEQLRAGMERAAEALEFERAAELRDQIQAIERTIERQGVVLPGGGDLDVLGLVTRPDGLALGMLYVRQGTLIDRATFFWPGLGLEEAGELLWSFLGQFYSPAGSIPPRIVVPWLPGDDSRTPPEEGATRGGAADAAPRDALTEPAGPDCGENMHAALEAALGDMRGGPVHVAAPRNADEHRLVDMAKSNAREAARSKADMPIAERLALALRLEAPVRRIECVDVSHTGGTATKVGVVVYDDGKALRDAYRVWNIEDAHGDDYAALSAWAARRVERGGPWPDMLLVDGGKGQLAAVDKVFRESFARDEHGNSRIPFFLAGIAKARDERGHADRRAGNVADRIFVPGRSNPLPLREGSAELLFLQAVRDAAHDFSLGRHRQARARQAFSGELQRLPGVGPHTARLLWDRFDSLEAMRAATPEDIAALPGIGRKRAEKLWQSLQGL